MLMSGRGSWNWFVSRFCFHIEFTASNAEIEHSERVQYKSVNNLILKKSYTVSINIFHVTVSVNSVTIRILVIAGVTA